MKSLFTLYVFFTGTIISLLADEYEVQGTMSYRFFDKNKANATLSEHTDAFAMSVDGCKWFLTKKPLSSIRLGKPQKMADYVAASSDLTNFYYLVSYGTLAKSNTNSLNTVSGLIGNGFVPYGQDPTITLIWYALASGCYLQQQGENEYIYGVIPFRNVGFYSKDFRAKAKWELETAPPHIPKAISFLGEYKFLQDEPDPNFPEPLNPIECVYKSLEFTNFAGVTLPMRGMAEFPNTNSVGTIFEFTVTNISTRSATKVFTLKIPDTAMLSDLRPISRSMPLAVVAARTKQWPDINDSKSKYEKMVQIEKTRKKAPTGQQSDATQTRNIVLIFLLLISLVFIVLVISIQMSKDGNTNK